MFICLYSITSPVSVICWPIIPTINIHVLLAAQSHPGGVKANLVWHFQFQAHHHWSDQRSHDTWQCPLTWLVHGLLVGWALWFMWILVIWLHSKLGAGHAVLIQWQFNASMQWQVSLMKCSLRYHSVMTCGSCVHPSVCDGPRKWNGFSDSYFTS